jgi:hypothetical protein
MVKFSIPKCLLPYNRKQVLCDVSQQGCSIFSLVFYRDLLYEAALQFNFSSITQNSFVLVFAKNLNERKKSSNFVCNADVWKKN